MVVPGLGVSLIVYSVLPARKIGALEPTTTGPRDPAVGMAQSHVCSSEDASTLCAGSTDRQSAPMGKWSTPGIGLMPIMN